MDYNFAVLFVTLIIIYIELRRNLKCKENTEVSKDFITKENDTNANKENVLKNQKQKNGK